MDTTVNWKVDGMTCSNCALTVSKYLEKEGLQNVKVNLMGGDVSFSLNNHDPETIAKGIKALGYEVSVPGREKKQARFRLLDNNMRRFFFCLIFTLPLLASHMLPWHIHWLMNPWVQLGFCLPVFGVGLYWFGRSAWNSLRNGMPNMNVLIVLGAVAAFVYSLIGMFVLQDANYLFFETTATIITLVFLGNYLEEASLHSTQRALNQLVRSQKVMANMIAFDDNHQEQVFPIENTQLRVGDLLLIRTGEQVPMDCKILWGEASVNESIITGESLPVEKKPRDLLIGGSLLDGGTVKAQVTATGDDTVLAGILNLVKQAQGEKPPIQQLADKISAIFVPVVTGIALLTLLINYYGFGVSFTDSLMRAIAVLVIACPCAMGLATPAAIAVGLGRGARNGILFRNATSLEQFKDIRRVVFDKTGTLTTGQFRIENFAVKDQEMTEDEFKQIIYSLEKYSGHPIAQSVAGEWKQKKDIRWQQIEEEKGRGMKAVAPDGTIYEAGSYALAEKQTKDDEHNIYLLKKGQLAGWVDLKDEVRPEAEQVVKYLKGRGITTTLLSGDRLHKCIKLAEKLGIDEVFAEQSPQQKLDRIAAFSAQAPTAMVGDGVNDAPALARATVGISMSGATQLAMQSAQVVLMQHGLKNLPAALGLGSHTYLTIKQNLFWAFFYNIIAIPVAAFGLLSPSFGALVMGFSDVVLAINSVRLFVKRIV